MSGPSKVKLITHKCNYEAMRMRFKYKWNPFPVKLSTTFTPLCVIVYLETQSLQILDPGQTIHCCQDLSVINCTVFPTKNSHKVSLRIVFLSILDVDIYVPSRYEWLNYSFTPVTFYFVSISPMDVLNKT